MESVLRTSSVSFLLCANLIKAQIENKENGHFFLSSFQGASFYPGGPEIWGLCSVSDISSSVVDSCRKSRGQAWDNLTANDLVAGLLGNL